VKIGKPGPLLAAFVLTALGAGAAVAKPPVRVSDVVADVMPGDVELAVIPRPKREKMGDRMIVVGRPAVVAPCWASLRAGKRQLLALLGMPANATALAEPPAKADTVVAICLPKDRALAKRYGPPTPGVPMDLAGLANSDQAYFLSVRYLADKKRNVIFIKALSEQGAFYAVQTLK
jgi:hypothetical protein